MSDVVDPIDEVIADFEKERAAEASHAQMLSQYASRLTNEVGRSFIAASNEARNKLSRFGIEFHSTVSHGSQPDAKVVIEAHRRSMFDGGKRLSTLTMRVLDDGTLEIKASGRGGSRPFSARSISLDEASAPEAAKRIFAEFVSHLLREI